MRKTLLWVLLLLIGVTAFAQTDPLIVVTGIWPPYRMEVDGKLVGIDVDLLDAIQRELGIPIEIQRHPFARCLEMIRHGQADFITGIAYTDERAEFVRYSPTPYSEVRSVFYVSRGRGAEIQSYEDLNGLRVGYSINSSYFEPFDSDTNLIKVGVSDEVQVLKMLVFGRVDAIVGTSPNLAYDVARLGYTAKVEPIAYIPEPTTPLYFGYTMEGDRQDIYDRIDNLLARFLSDGSLEAILERYR